MLAGSVRLQPFSSPGLRQLAPAGDGDLAALCWRTLLFQPRGSPGESQVPPGEAGVPERPRSARRQLAPSGNRDRRAFSSACNAGRAGAVGSTAWEGATRTPMMDSPAWRAGCCCLLLLALVGSARSEDMPSCEEVRKLFQWRLVGGVKGLPDSPRAGPDLQVCISKKPTCCTRKMEERYQIAARQDMQQVLQTSSSTLKFLISRNAAAFQETLER
uniref:Uncharacterized protein n=1 Tax=Mustela putorius furo TaxID=9669 RepID=M3YKC9_MUSPF